jgi:hypothetical protein
VVGDAAVDPASEPAEPAEPAEPVPASKHSRDVEKDKQPGEYAPSEMKRTASHINASKTFLPTHRLVLRSHVGHQPEEVGAEIRHLLEELVDLREQQRKASSKEDEVVSRLRVALGYIENSTMRNLFEGDKLSRWGDSAGAYSPDGDTLRPRKRARRSS